MPDNWGFVFAAYALGAIVFIGYWRRLMRREREALPRAPVNRRRPEPGARA